MKPDGTRISKPEEWAAQKQIIRDLAQTHMYGRWPGKVKSLLPTVKRREVRYDGEMIAVLEEVTLFVDNAFEMDLKVLRPESACKIPVIVFIGNHCPIEYEVLKSGYAIAYYNRDHIVPDWSSAKYQGTEDEARVRTYPTLDCGAIMAWAWGASIAADYLKTCEYAGPLIVTGHSRDGKAALCAGIFDERFAIVAPIGSGCGGAGSARFLGTADGSRQNGTRCETIGRITHAYPDWFGGTYAQYGSSEEPFYPLDDKVSALPLDAHMLRAACAPNAVFDSEGEQDDWCNTFGTQLCWQASQKVFDFLGVPEKNGFHMRKGRHAFNAHDWAALIYFCDTVLKREPLIPHDDINKPTYDIDLKEYAPWR
jgi:hypothetical protein